MLPATEQRVPAQTSTKVNDAIRHDALARLKECAANPEAIPRRLAELDHEWDVERTLEANAATIALVGLMLAALLSWGFLIIPAVVATFLLQHALQGWCPPLPILRRLKFRTAREIESERVALKAMRGDFGNAITDPERAFVASEP